MSLSNRERLGADEAKKAIADFADVDRMLAGKGMKA